MNKVNVLVYARPWNKEQFSNLASGIWPDATQVITSEHSSIDQSDLHNKFYELLSSDSSVLSCGTALSEEEVLDVIGRCRLLRAIDSSFARKLVYAMEVSVLGVLDKNKPKMMISITVDSYILHLFSLACVRRGIPFVGLIPTFLKDTFRITTLGERLLTRSVSAAECVSALSVLENVNYKPDFVSLNVGVQRRKAIKLWRNNLIKPVWFRLKRFFTRDTYNYHYHQAQVVSEQYWSFLPQEPISLSIRSPSDLAESIDSRSVLFLPLQMSPEATVDYWSVDSSWVEYESKVFQLLDALGDRYNVLIKEHPNVVGYRRPSFYKRLHAYQRKGLCRQVDPYLNSNLVLDKSDGVLLCTGSVGFEAAIRGIPVYTDSLPFYLPADVFLPISNLLRGNLRKNLTLSYEEKLGLVRYLLECTLPGRFVNDGSWCEMTDCQSLMVNGIQRYIYSRLPEAL